MVRTDTYVATKDEMYSFQLILGNRGSRYKWLLIVKTPRFIYDIKSGVVEKVRRER
jgi:hypothetical protein